MNVKTDAQCPVTISLRSKHPALHRQSTLNFLQESETAMTAVAAAIPIQCPWGNHQPSTRWRVPLMWPAVLCSGLAAL